MDKFPLEDARARCTDLRLRLFDNGFDPLPNENKIPRLKDWSRVKITEDMIRSRTWARSNKTRDTGIRCGDVVALDWDINDKSLLNDLLDLVVDQKIIEESPFVRIGMKPREMWIYRTKEKIGKRSTGFFARPGADPDDKSEQVEILGAGCQFAAFGQRDPTTAYTWPVNSLADYKLMDLPLITAAQVEALKDFAVLFFEERGLVRKSAEGGTDEGYTHAYDLTPDMIFDVRNIGNMTVAEMQTYLEGQPENTELRCRVQALRPGTSGSLAGQASLSNGVVCISDHGSYTSHFPADLASNNNIEALGTLLAERPAAAMFARPEPVLRRQRSMELDRHGVYEDNYGIVLDRYIYVAELDTVADVVTNRFDIPLANFRNMMAPYYTVELGPKKGETLHYLADQWLRDKDRREVRLALMRPDKPYPLYEEKGDGYFNTYRDHDLPTHGQPALGFDLLEKLLPVPAERHYFTQWLSFKVQFPDTRGPGVMMVANDSYGTGRGTLIELVSKMFAPGLVREIDFETLAGRGTQGQYNEWLADAVIVAVNEAQEVTGSAWRNRTNLYEHLKEVIDPGKHSVYVKRKGLKNYMGRTSASLLIMTNHADSVAIPKGDRRIAVLENGEKQPQEYWNRFRAWMAEDANVGAFVEQLKKYPLDGYQPYAPPPMTHAKTDMIDASTSSLDQAVNHVLDAMTGSLLTREQLVLALERYVVEYSVEMPTDWQKAILSIYQRRTRTPLGGPSAILIDGKMRFIRQLRQPPAGTFDTEKGTVSEVLLNGPVTRPLQNAAKAVNLG
jgi:hypothetical protein